MISIILALSISFVITFLTIPVVIFLSNHFNIYDLPDERKVHERPISSLGGLGIFAGLVMTILLLVAFDKASEFQFFVAAAILIFFLGLKDDLLALSPLKKFIGQTIAALLIIYKGGVQIKSMHGLAGINELPEVFSLLLTYFTMIVIINSINLIDGVDGLAGSIVLLASLILGFYFLQINLAPYAILSLALAGSLIAFLYFNFQPAKIFMGDTGSLLIGTIASILLIKFIELSAGNISFPVVSGPAIGFSILIIPLLDTLRVFGLRILKGRSPFSPDRNHIHHMLLKRGLTHQQTTMVLVAANAYFIIFSFFARSIGNTWLLILMIGQFFIAVGIVNYLNNQSMLLQKSLLDKKNLLEKKLVNMPKPSKVVSLNNEIMSEEKQRFSLQNVD